MEKLWESDILRASPQLNILYALSHQNYESVKKLARDSGISHECAIIALDDLCLLGYAKKSINRSTGISKTSEITYIGKMLINSIIDFIKLEQELKK